MKPMSKFQGLGHWPVELNVAKKVRALQAENVTGL